MFPVLTTDSLLSTLGLGTLSDAISCEVEEERNGSYELTLEYPQGGAHAGDIAMNALILAKPNFTDDPQPFRIYSITKDISGKIEVHAQHISYDLGGVVVSPTTMTGATCKQAGDYLLTGTPFTFKTDKTNSADFKVDVPSSARSWFGGKSGSLMGVYGTGEYHYDGYDVEFNLHRGTNRGVELRYGKNLTELKSEADCSNLASSVVCFYEDNGTVVSGTAVSTGLVGITRELAIDVSDDYDTPPSVATLTARATQYITDHNLTAPKTNITLDFVQASKLKDRVDLCDTVSIYYEALGVSAVTKCIRTVWDVLAERYTETEFGDAKTNIADTIVEVEQVAAEAVTKTVMEQAIDSATEQITGNNGGYIVLHDANNDGEPDELLIMDSPDISTAVKIWRFNSSGLGYSSTGYSGTYGLAITQNGAIVADFITAGTLNANVIRAGIIQDSLGHNSWDLDTGALTITDGSINIITTSATSDKIILSYGAFTTSLQPSGVTASQSTYNFSQFQAAGVFCYPNTGSAVSSFTGYGVIIKDHTATTTLVDMSGSRLHYNDSSGNTGTELKADEFSIFDSSSNLRLKLNNAGEVHLYDASANEMFRVTPAGLFFYDTDGDNRFEIDRSGEAVVRIKNGSGVTRMALANTSLTFTDGSSVERGKYAYNGLTLSNSSGVATAAFPDGVDFASDISIYNNRGTINEKVCRKWGNFRFISIIMQSTHTATNSPRMITLGSANAPAREHALSCVDITGGSGTVGDAIPCKVNTSGNVFMQSTTSGKAYAITGFYYL